MTPLCDLGHVTSSLRASDSPTGKKDINSTYLTGLLQGLNEIIYLQHLKQNQCKYYISAATIIIIIIIIIIKTDEAGTIAIAEVFLCTCCIRGPGLRSFYTSHLVFTTILLLFTWFTGGNENVRSLPCILLRTRIKWCSSHNSMVKPYSYRAHFTDKES